MIEAGHVTMGRVIGRGSFKVVREAQLRIPGAGAPTTVAAAEVAASALGAEAEVLVGLGRHPNLVRFIGMYEASPNVVLITEYAPLGDLENHLKDDDVEDSITTQHRTVIIAQVTRAVESCCPCFKTGEPGPCSRGAEHSHKFVLVHVRMRGWPHVLCALAGNPTRWPPGMCA